VVTRVQDSEVELYPKSTAPTQTSGLGYSLYKVHMNDLYLLELLPLYEDLRRGFVLGAATFFCLALDFTATRDERGESGGALGGFSGGGRVNEERAGAGVGRAYELHPRERDWERHRAVLGLLGVAGRMRPLRLPAACGHREAAVEEVCSHNLKQVPSGRSECSYGDL
jgi:hypothetical protein